MTRYLHQVAFAVCFTLLGVAITILAMVAMDSRQESKAPQHASTGSDCPITEGDHVSAPIVQTHTIPAHTTANSTATQHTQPQASKPTDSVIQFRKGSSLVVYDILNKDKPGIEFVPLYNSQDEFDKVAVYRQTASARSTSYDKTMDMIYPLQKPSAKFPPVSQADAQRKAQNYRPNSYPEYQGRLVTYAGVDIPYYYFKMSDHEGALLIDAFTGMAQVISRKELDDEKKFQDMQGNGLDRVMTVDANGRFYTPPEVLKRLPERERKVILAEQNFFNDMIEKGLLKIDQNGQFIEDNITAEHRASFDNTMEKLMGSVVLEDMH